MWTVIADRQRAPPAPQCSDDLILQYSRGAEISLFLVKARGGGKGGGGCGGGDLRERGTGGWSRMYKRGRENIPDT